MRLSRPSLPTALLMAAVATSGVLLLVWQSHLTFFFDEWDPLLHRRGFDADILLRPHIDHILLATTLFYKAVQATIGMESVTPYAVVSTASFLLSVVLLFVYLRRRVGEWLALAGVLPVLFLGSGNQDLLSPFQIFFTGAMASGIGALLALERSRGPNDLLACALLTISFTFSELALPFVLGVAVAIALDRGPLRRAYVVLVPLVFYAAWYAGWGHTGPDYLSFNNVAHSLSYVLDGLAAGVASFLGLVPGGFASTGGLGWGRPLLLVLLVAAAIRLRSALPIPRAFWVTAVILLSFWFLTASNATIGRPPIAARYQYIGVVLSLLVAANLTAGIRVTPRGIAIALGVACLAVAGNISALHQSYLGFASVTPTIRGGLAGLEIAADSVDPNLELTAQNSDFNYVGSIRAGPYLSAVDAFGSPAYSEAELPGAPAQARAAADKVMAAALGLRLTPATGDGGGAPGCVTVRPSAGAPAVLAVPAGGAKLIARGTAQVALRRFSTEVFPVSLGGFSGAAMLAIPRDASMRPWQMQVTSARPVDVCPVSG
jgi:hypothetical protein